MSTQHTPGPWQIGNFDPNTVFDCDGEKRGCSPIATMQGTAAERKANARLIAAAPDLLDALVKMLDVWEHGGTTPYPIAEARAAIKKATGAA